MRWAASPGAQRESLRRTNRPAGALRAIPRSINGGNPGEVTRETRGSRPGVPLNKSRGDGTPGSFGGAGGPGVRVGGFAGGVLAAGCSQGFRGLGSCERRQGGIRRAVCWREGGVGRGMSGDSGFRVGKMVT